MLLWGESAADFHRPQMIGVTRMDGSAVRPGEGGQETKLEGKLLKFLKLLFVTIKFLHTQAKSMS
jgi:hypothetical protein